MRIVLATHNTGKLSEFKRLFTTFQSTIEITGLEAFPDLATIPETGKTFFENALLKAKSVAEYTQSLSIADDSGLEVDAINGQPGVYSARFSGDNATDVANNQKLLDCLHEVPFWQRKARFKCVLVACAPHGEARSVEGVWEGIIVTSPRGNHGFGYDPLFLDPELGLTAAEMDQTTKNARSHRGQALQKLIAIWPEVISLQEIENTSP